MRRTIDEVVDAMMATGWKPKTPASTVMLINVERLYGIHLPHDFRAFFGISNGGGRPPYGYRGLMQLEELHVFNKHYEVPANFPGLVAFANEGFLVYAFDYRTSETVIVSLGLSSSDWGDVVKEADTFTEWLEDGLTRTRP